MAPCWNFSYFVDLFDLDINFWYTISIRCADLFYDDCIMLHSLFKELYPFALAFLFSELFCLECLVVVCGFTVA